MSKRYKIQMYDNAGRVILGSGGNCYVAIAGAAGKQTLTDVNGASLSNPIALSQGLAEFYVADSISSVDVYVMTPGGQFTVEKTLAPGTLCEINVDTSDREQVAVIPFAIGDTAAATETDTGFDLPLNAIAKSIGGGVLVSVLDATETIDVGLLSTESGGDANGFFITLAVATEIFNLPSLANGALTLGAMLVADEDGAGALVPEAHRGDGVAESICYTLTTGTDTAEGFIFLPYMIGAV